MSALAHDRAPASTGERLLRRLVLAVAMLGFWVLLTWPFGPGGEPLWPELLVGIGLAGVVAAVVGDLVTRDLGRLLNPVRYLWAAVFFLVLAWHVVRANVDVALRVLRPSLPIRPGIVRMRTRLESASARTALANAITLTPGTLTVDVADDGTFYVHWIFVETVEDEAAARLILARFEWLIGRILE